MFVKTKVFKAPKNETLWYGFASSNICGNKVCQT